MNKVYVFQRMSIRPSCWKEGMSDQESIKFLQASKDKIFFMFYKNNSFYFMKLDR